MSCLLLQTSHLMNTSLQSNATILSLIQLLLVCIFRQVINVISLAGVIYLSGLLCVSKHFVYFTPQSCVETDYTIYSKQVQCRTLHHTSSAILSKYSDHLSHQPDAEQAVHAWWGFTEKSEENNLNFYLCILKMFSDFNPSLFPLSQ